MTIEVYDKNNKKIDELVIGDQDHMDICPYKGVIRRVFYTISNNIRTYYIVVGN